MWKPLSVALCSLAILAAGCQDKPSPNLLQLQGSSSVTILDARIVNTSSNSVGMVAGTTVAYEIVKLKLKNDFSNQLLPKAYNFVLVDMSGNRYPGLDTGNAAMIGISNDYSVMQRGDTREFTVAFGIGYQVAGQIAYEF